MKKIYAKKLYLTLFLISCLVFLFLIGYFYVEEEIIKTKHIPITEGLSNNHLITTVYLI
jgi:hypothetical protein